MSVVFTAGPGRSEETAQREATFVPTGARWLALAAACLVVIAFQVAAMSWGPLLGEVAKSLAIPLDQTVGLMAIYMLFAALSFFVAGWLSFRAGAALTIVLSALFSAAPAGFVSLAGDDFGALMALRAVQGCGVGFGLAGLAALVTQWFPPQERGLAYGLPGACNPIGVGVGVVAAPVLLERFGDWRQVVLILSATGWAAALFAAVALTAVRSRAPARAEDHRAGAAIAAAMRMPVTWIGVVATFAVNWVMQTVFSLSPSFLAEPHPVGLGLGVNAAGQLMGLVQLGAIVGPIVGGLILDRLCHGRVRVVLLLAFAFAACYGALGFDAVTGSRWPFLAVLVVCGAGIGMLFPMIQSQIATIYEPSIVGPMNGIWLGLGAFGGSAGLFVASLSLGRTGSYGATTAIIAAVAIVGFLASWPVTGTESRTDRRQ